jgi:hypothetical protein
MKDEVVNKHPVVDMNTVTKCTEKILMVLKHLVISTVCLVKALRLTVSKYIWTQIILPQRKVQTTVGKAVVDDMAVIQVVVSEDETHTLPEVVVLRLSLD